MIFNLTQSQSVAATEAPHGGASSAAVRVCLICGKTPEETAFTKSQKKRLRLGKTATCKLCASQKQVHKVAPPRICPTDKRCLIHVVKMRMLQLTLERFVEGCMDRWLNSLILPKSFGMHEGNSLLG